MSLSAISKSRLELQGFSCQKTPGLEKVEPWLRVTPGISTAVILLGTATRSKSILWLFAALSAFASTQRVHPLDRLSNGLRERRGENTPLPDNPAPRRFAMGLAALLAATAGAFFASGRYRAGFATGSALSLSGLTVASTHFCPGSFIYQHLRPVLPERQPSSRPNSTVSPCDHRLGPP